MAEQGSAGSVEAVRKPVTRHIQAMLIEAERLAAAVEHFPDPGDREKNGIPSFAEATDTLLRAANLARHAAEELTDEFCKQMGWREL